MKKIMPTAMILQVSSWMMLAAGTGYAILFFASGGSRALPAAAGAAIAGIALWSLLRMAANAGQNLFELKCDAMDFYNFMRMENPAQSRQNAEYAAQRVEKGLAAVHDSLATLTAKVALMVEETRRAAAAGHDDTALVEKQLAAVRTGLEMVGREIRTLDTVPVISTQTETLRDALRKLAEVFSARLNTLAAVQEGVSRALAETGTVVVRAVGDSGSAVAAAVNAAGDSVKRSVDDGSAGLARTIEGTGGELSGILARDDAAVKIGNTLEAQAKLMQAEIERLRESVIQMNCDSKDVNQNIQQIKVFFEAVERHLHLNR